MTQLAELPSKVEENAEPDMLPTSLNGEAFQRSIGNVPWDRVVFDPPPGTVSGAFYDAVEGRWKGRLVELVNRTLVEKPMGHEESRIGANLIIILGGFVKRMKLGFITMADDLVKMAGGNRRQPDVAVYLKSDYPGGVRPTEKVTSLPPRLAVEVLSEDNTPSEIDMKLREFFASGCRLAYVIDPKERVARRHVSADEFTTLDAEAMLDGGDVVPGFEVKLKELLDED